VWVGTELAHAFGGRDVQEDLARKAAHKELRAISSQLAGEEGQKTSKRAKADAKKAEQKAKKAERGSGANLILLRNPSYPAAPSFNLNFSRRIVPECRVRARRLEVPSVQSRVAQVSTLGSYAERSI